MLSTKITEAALLPVDTSTQRAEPTALRRALEVAAGKRVNTQFDLKYAFSTVHALGTTRKERGLLTA